MVSIYTSNEIAEVQRGKIPKHVAIIPDGNRRWARKRSLFAKAGHRKGAQNVIDIVKAAKELTIETLTIYTFSTENWNRSKIEISALMWILEDFVTQKREEMLLQGIKLLTIGDPSKLPKRTWEKVQKTMEVTKNCDKISLVLALNYGSRDEICRAVKRIVTDVKNDKIQQNDINEALISSYLDTADLKDPELFIRTSGEIRVSNFLLWQISYSEIYITDILWPDFRPADLLEALRNFQMRDRRLGGS